MSERADREPNEFEKRLIRSLQERGSVNPNDFEELSPQDIPEELKHSHWNQPQKGVEMPYDEMEDPMSQLKELTEINRRYLEQQFNLVKEGYKAMKEAAKEKDPEIFKHKMNIVGGWLGLIEATKPGSIRGGV